ncbi:conjugal transfer protein [Listeria booriae]|uniref:conjugal transfer protein n=1 Tax=Listeria booriae TaxID=1552123 RepID=UPI002880403B|nr:conjugal transfer protein [Listeria booriae]MDT0109336.1 conjugal transfer protein [Listeria booriae]
MNRAVYNYRKIYRQQGYIREYAEGKSLPFPIPTILVGNAIAFSIFMLLLAKIFGFFIPHFAYPNWMVAYIAIPVLYAFLVGKIQPDGKNIYIFMFDFVRYIYRYRILKIKIANDFPFEYEKEVRFNKIQEVVRKKYVIKNTNANITRKYVINKDGRRVGFLQD